MDGITLLNHWQVTGTQLAANGSASDRFNHFTTLIREIQLPTFPLLGSTSISAEQQGKGGLHIIKLYLVTFPL